MLFKSTGLMADLLRAVEKEGYEEPTAVQVQAIPLVLEKRDLLVGAQTGTGKTGAFALPILHNLSTAQKSSHYRLPRALVLAPTRELAQQVTQSFTRYGSGLGMRSLAVFGGVSIRPQKKALLKGVDILVATPGRLLDHCADGDIDFSQLEVLVMDEADRMLDMGFIHDLRKITAVLPSGRQNLMFSATYTKEIKNLAKSFLKNPVHLEIERRTLAADTVEQLAYRVERAEKRHLLTKMIEEGQWYQVLVFARTKHGAGRLATQLQKAGIEADAIHGDKSQNARLRALKNFKTGNLRVLVGTDVAARGLDIGGLEYVVNFDLPNVPDDYVHRIGRTGRAGKTGNAISFVCPDERKLLRDIEARLKTEIRLVDGQGSRKERPSDGHQDAISPVKDSRNGNKKELSEKKPSAIKSRKHRSQCRRARPRVERSLNRFGKRKSAAGG